jgi:hypothetical protein
VNDHDGGIRICAHDDGGGGEPDDDDDDGAEPAETEKYL